MVCQFFAPNSLISWITLAKSQEEEEHKQLQSILRFMQTQQTTKHEIIRNPKNDTQKTNANDN